MTWDFNTRDEIFKKSEAAQREREKSLEESLSSLGDKLPSMGNEELLDLYEKVTMSTCAFHRKEADIWRAAKVLVRREIDARMSGGIDRSHLPWIPISQHPRDTERFVGLRYNMRFARTEALDNCYWCHPLNRFIFNGHSRVKEEGDIQFYVPMPKLKPE